VPTPPGGMPIFSVASLRRDLGNTKATVIVENKTARPA